MRLVSIDSMQASAKRNVQELLCFRWEDKMPLGADDDGRRLENGENT